MNTEVFYFFWPNFLTTEEVRLITFGLLYELVKYLMLIIFFRLKKKFKIALEENPLVIPGKDLRETYTFFIGKDCYNELLSQERDQVYEEHQQELKHQAKLDFQELLWEKLDLFVRMIGTTDTITQEDIKFITKELEDDSRYVFLPPHTDASPFFCCGPSWS